MSLEEYQRKRQFSKTPEPSGSQPSSENQWRFVIQKHAARSLHYDLRLELDGVLKSWAVPKGPSLDPRDKRLAIQTEDHPLEYVNFEGIIPQGEYGGGTVLVWDTGTWSPINENGFESGDFKFRLNGHKLQGGWMLVHTGRRKGETNQWLLFKERDQAARSIEEYDVVADQPSSVLSNRTLEQIAEDKDAVWSSQPGAVKQAVTRSRKVKGPRPVAGLSKIKGTSKKRFPTKTISPSIPTASRQPPIGDQWVHELKYDGYRMLCRIDKGKVTFTSRNGKDWTQKLPHMALQMQGLPVKQAILDGEIVAMATDGTTDFQLLQNTIGSGNDTSLQYFVFDLLYVDGYDLSGATLLDRKTVLLQILPVQHPVIRFSEHIEGQGDVVFEQACRLGAEGIVSKHARHRYIEGRTDSWIKTKSLKSAEFIIGGFTDSKATQRGFGALAVGRFDESRQLMYEGRVGTGFTTDTLDQLAEIMLALETDSSPFANLQTGDVGRDFHWVLPQLVVEIEYGGWTRDGYLRFPTFRGLRDDIDPTDVVKTDADLESGAEAEVTDLAATNHPPAAAGLESLRFTNPERIMYPAEGVTKLGVATYVAEVAEWMLPHVVGRPLALVRCPKGCRSKCFFQKKPPSGMPKCVVEATVTWSGKSQPAIVIRDVEGLLTLIQFSALEIHTWGCRIDKPGRPDTVVFDLDPDESIPFARVCEAAVLLREKLEAVELQGFVKTSGGKGLHVVLPIRRHADWNGVRTFCDGLAARLGRESPGRFTTSPSKKARRGKIYIDTLRNRFGATTIAPYSMRSRDGASVSMPIHWEEVASLRSADCYSIRNAAARLRNQDADPWEEFFEMQQSLTKHVVNFWQS